MISRITVTNQVEPDMDWLDVISNDLYQAYPPRDEFHLHLIEQELPMWFQYVIDKKEDRIIPEANELSQRRGFDTNETILFKGLASTLFVNADRIRKLLFAIPCEVITQACDALPEEKQTSEELIKQGLEFSNSIRERGDKMRQV